jgi:hypothetical protein
VHHVTVGEDQADNENVMTMASCFSLRCSICLLPVDCFTGQATTMAMRTRMGVDSEERVNSGPGSLCIHCFCVCSPSHYICYSHFDYGGFWKYIQQDSWHDSIIQHCQEQRLRPRSEQALYGSRPTTVCGRVADMDLQSKYTASTFKNIKLLRGPGHMSVLRELKGSTLSDLDLLNVVQGLIVHGPSLSKEGVFALGMVIDMLCLHPKFRYMSFLSITDMPPALLKLVSEQSASIHLSVDTMVFGTLCTHAALTVAASFAHVNTVTLTVPSYYEPSHHGNGMDVLLPKVVRFELRVGQKHLQTIVNTISVPALQSFTLSIDTSANYSVIALNRDARALSVAQAIHDFLYGRDVKVKFFGSQPCRFVIDKTLLDPEDKDNMGREELRDRLEIFNDRFSRDIALAWIKVKVN